VNDAQLCQLDVNKTDNEQSRKAADEFKQGLLALLSRPLAEQPRKNHSYMTGSARFG
jgi:hypothetical protein